MKNSGLLALLVFLFLPSLADAQCYISSHMVSEIHVHDTTYQTMVVDTAVTGITGFTYTWLYDDGTTHLGPSVRFPITDASIAHSFTVSASAPGTVCSATGSASTAFVFNCASMPSIGYGYPGSYTFRQTQITDPNSTYIQFPHSNANDLSLKVNMHINWGNGTSIYTSQSLDTLAPIGGIADPTHSSHYQYAGQYRVNTQYSYSYDTLTCPLTALPQAAIWVAGRAGNNAPQIGGSRTYCVGDTLRLGIVDTIAQFLNAYHRADTTGVAHYDIVPMTDGTYPTYGPNRLFSWSHDGSFFGLSLDTTLVIPNLTMADTGIYYMQMWENISLTDTILKVHVTINNTSPTVAAITGASSVCEGNIISLTNTTPGGIWSSSSSNVTVSGNIVSGITAGSATITYTVTNTCGITSVTYPISVVPSAVCIAGIVEHTTNNGILIYPNPSSGSFVVSVPGNDATVTVTDVTGKIITVTQSAGNSEIPVLLNNLAKGTYLIKVDCGGKTFRDKISIY